MFFVTLGWTDPLILQRMAGLIIGMWCQVHEWRECIKDCGEGISLVVWPHPSCPLACDCPAMASMMASCEYMLIGVLYWAWTIVAFPPGPFTSMGLWVDRAESFRAMGLKLGVYSTLLVSGVSGWRRRWGGFRCRSKDERLTHEVKERGVWEERNDRESTKVRKPGQHVVMLLTDS